MIPTAAHRQSWRQRMFRVLAAPALMLAMPAAASAAPFNELPFQPVSGGAACLRPTGAPDELVRWYPGGAEVLTVGPSGLAAQARVPLGRRIACPEMASDRSGAAIVAAASGGRVRVALREPGGTWGAPFALPSRQAGDLAVAVSSRGDAVVIWIEGVDQIDARPRARVARRVAGGAFGAPESLGASTRYFQQLAAGMDASGEATVMFTTDGTRGRERVNVATARPGAPFGAPKRLGRGSIGEPALAVAADGRALVTASGYEGLEVYERPPGGDFGPRTIPYEASAENTTIVLRPSGAAVIAWQNTPGEDVIAVVRDGAVPFGEPIRVLEPPPPDTGGDSGGSFGAILDDVGPPPETSQALRAALGADGRALLVWSTEDRGVGTATVTSSGRTEIGTLGSPLREPFGPSPLLLADGARALAWTDGRSYLSSGPLSGRLHLALEGAPALPAPPAPAITAGKPRRSALRPAQPLLLPVRCSAACDLRAWLPGRRDNFITASRSRAGTVVLRFQPLVNGIAPARPGPVRITLQSGAPGAARARQQTVPVRLRRLPSPPLPRINDLRVRRRGDDLVVRWRTDVPMRDGYLFVYATSTRKPESDREPVFGSVPRGGRSFRVVLRDAARKRFVRVSAVQPYGERIRTRTIRAPFAAA
jgi:hypothetical protein